MHSSSRCRGFSVIEALIAAALVASALVGLAHLVALGAERARASRYSAGALTAAQSKLEELRGAALAYDADGTRLNADVLSLSPPASLNEDTAGYVDFLDAFGQNVSSEAGDVLTDYVRRWSVTPFAAGDLDTLVLRACVLTAWNRRFANPVPEVCVVSIRTRTS